MHPTALNVVTTANPSGIWDMLIESHFRVMEADRYCMKEPLHLKAFLGSGKRVLSKNQWMSIPIKRWAC